MQDFLHNDWQLSGVLTAGSANHVNNDQPGGRYDLTFNYQDNGTAVNLTGSPDYNARIVYLGDPGSGCSGDQYRQFNTAAVTGPQYRSVGLESGRNLLGGCPDKTVDLALAGPFGSAAAGPSSSGSTHSTSSIPS